jgi:putative ABC transport system permease protein
MVVRQLTTQIMFRNYFKTAWRNFINNKVYSTINILGLAAGMAVALLIGLWVHYAFSFNKFLPDYEQLYQVKRNFNSNGDTLTFNTTSLKLADALRNQVAEIEYVAESDWMGRHGLMVGDKKIYKRGAQIGSDFLKMFQYPLVEGNAATVLKDPYSIVLTESMAKALFGNENPMNKMVRFDNRHDLKVTGILKDIPANSSLQFNFLVPFSYYEQNTDWVKSSRTGSFGENSFQIFVRLKPGVSSAQVAPKIRDIENMEKNNVSAMNSKVIMQPLARWRLYAEYKNGKEAGGFIDYVRMFGIIGVLVLLIACINFVNLTTARSEKRAREVGVRKAVGSGRRALVFQFLTESFLYTLLAFICALVLLQLSLPAFNTLTKTDISIPFGNGYFWLLMVAGITGTALLAGSRPAFYLSSFQPVKVLKGKLTLSKANAWPRKMLVVLQFSCSVALIISTIIINRQLQHAKDRPTGYDTNRLLRTNMNDDLRKNYTALKNDLIQQGIATGVTHASSPATDIYWHTNIEQWQGKRAGETVEMGAILTGKDYFKTLGISLAKGRDFEGPADSNSIIFNEAAIKRLRLKEPVNQVIPFDGKDYHVVGVAKDALMLSPFAAADPTMFFYAPRSRGVIMYRLSPGISTTAALTKLTALFNKYDPAFPYSYEFEDENYAAKFNLETLIGRLSGIFAGLAIFISCLGLFGLAAYVAEQRTKEIGIRKVLGASVSQVWVLLSKDFVVLVLVSCIMASPLAYYFLHNWLQQYEYRIVMGPFIFILASVVALAITIITISFQAIKAALANPVKSLRSE